MSPSTLAAILKESFPPSTARPSSDITLHMAVQASYKAAPSPGSLAAHIQLPLHFTSYNKQFGTCQNCTMNEHRTLEGSRSPIMKGVYVSVLTHTTNLYQLTFFVLPNEYNLKRKKKERSKQASKQASKQTNKQTKNECSAMRKCTDSTTCCSYK
jgi:hypothetical protein